VRKLLPNCQIFGGDGEPAEGEHVTAGLRHVPSLLPCDLVNHSYDRAPLRRRHLSNLTCATSQTTAPPETTGGTIDCARNPQPTGSRRVVGVVSAACAGVLTGCVTGNCSTV